MTRRKPGPRPGHGGRPVTRPDVVTLHVKIAREVKARSTAEAKAHGVSLAVYVEGRLRKRAAFQNTCPLCGERPGERISADNADPVVWLCHGCGAQFACPWDEAAT